MSAAVSSVGRGDARFGSTPAASKTCDRIAGGAMPCHLVAMQDDPSARNTAAACIAAAPRCAGRALIKIYRYTLSPLIGFHCRHLPTCSDYADQALARFGLWAGGWM